MRAGGVSSGSYGTLNLGLHVADDAADVLANRRLVERWAGGPVAYATQVHGAGVVVVPDQVGPQGPTTTTTTTTTTPTPTPTSVGEFDALVSASGAGLAVLVADCVPVLLADPVTGVVAAVHAGRQGLARGVVQAALATMADLGARPERIRAAIGPAICGACYEVPAALRAEVAAVVPATRSEKSWGTPALDLPAGVAAILAGGGVTHVQQLAICTLTDARFYSHRAQPPGHPTGRFAGVIRTDAASPGRVGGDR